LSFAQERLWFLSHFEPGGSNYNLPVAMEIEGALRAGAMEKAVNALVARHEILRTTYVARDGVPYQEIAPEPVLQLDQRDLSDLDDDGLWRWMVDECERPFDLEADGVLRAYLLRRGPSRHVLLLNLHHIAFDGWSLAILKRELSVYYRAFLMGTPPLLPPLPLQCADFAEWQRKELSGAYLDTQVEFWKARLAGAEALAFPRRQNAAGQSGREPLDLTPELAARLYAMCSREGVTLFMLLLASFQALLSRYTGQTDISVGAPVANRDPIETEELIGFFVNTLVFRQDMSGDPSFRDLLARVRDTALDALSNADVPFERVVEIVQPERSLNRSPLFQAMLAVQPKGGRLEIPGARVTNLSAPQESAKFDLLLALEDEDGSLHGALTYSQEVLTPADARRLVVHFRNLLEAILENPDCEISRLPILTEAERRALLEDWSRPSSGPAEPPSVLRAFQQIAAETPKRLAVVSEGTAVTYGELDNWSDAIASELQGRGVARQSVVGVLLERSAEAIAACLGTLKAGCAYLPLDPAHPDERLTLLLADSGARTVLTTGEAAARLARLPVQEIDIRFCTASSGQSCTYDVHPDDIAYVLYTSGSTGTPKGIPVTHRGLWNTVDAVRREIGFTDGDVMPSLTTFTFDIAALEVFLPLSSGGRVTVVPPAVASDGEQLAEFLRTGGITVVQATPATWQMAIDSGWQGGPLLKILSGGEAMSRKLAGALLDRAQAVWNLYGPTETTIYATGYRVRREPGPPPIGRPLQNTRVYVLDRFLQPAPIGLPGELYIGGAGVARGYLKRPELTRARFVDDPYLNGGGRLYRTGDLVRWREDGELEFLGRIDDQLKVRGFRVEPAEVEAALMAVPGVRQAAVVVRERSEQDRVLVAYAALDAGCTVTPQEVQRHLRRRLPDYMVPAGIKLLDSLPLGRTGKIDRKALAALPWGGLEAVGTAPQTPMEILIAQIWSDLFDIPVTGTEANFFSLGGHSLLAARVVSRLRKAVGVPVPVKLVFQSPTIGELALSVAQLQAESIEEAELAKLLDEIEGGSASCAAGGQRE
jgi:amino acid adenylation domain-containing protein